MLLSELKDGMVLVLRSEAIVDRFILNGNFYDCEDMNRLLWKKEIRECYNEDLTSKVISACDIMEVKYMGKTLWKRVPRKFVDIEEAKTSARNVRFDAKDDNEPYRNFYYLISTKDSLGVRKMFEERLWEIEPVVEEKDKNKGNDSCSAIGKLSAVQIFKPIGRLKRIRKVDELKEGMRILFNDTLLNEEITGNIVITEGLKINNYTSRNGIFTLMFDEPNKKVGYKYSAITNNDLEKYEFFQIM